MHFKLLLLTFALTLRLCVGSPTPVQHESSTKIQIRAIDDDPQNQNNQVQAAQAHPYGDWRAAHFDRITAIQPLFLGATTMQTFYHLVLAAAQGRWRQTLPPRAPVYIVWGRVTMLMLVQGLDVIPWDLVAQWCTEMIGWINNGHAGYTYAGYYLQAGQRNGLFIAVRLLGDHEALNHYLNGALGALDPAHP
ncbi:MAG: hypothetical protein Q9220_004394 [cf. Caloplaca sp. 1 TL-2023]